jgi:hypothetical protein
MKVFTAFGQLRLETTRIALTIEVHNSDTREGDPDPDATGKQHTSPPSWLREDVLVRSNSLFLLGQNLVPHLLELMLNEDGILPSEVELFDQFERVVFLSLLDQPSRRLWEEWRGGEHQQSEEDLDSKRKTLL